MRQLRIKNEKLSIRKSGFTLIEIVVSIAVFVMFLGIIATSYVGIVRAQQQTNLTRGAIAEARNFMESLAQDFRLGTIDYKCYDEAFLNNAQIECPIAHEPFFRTKKLFLALVDRSNSRKNIYWFDSDAKTVKLRKFEGFINNGFVSWIAQKGYEDGWRALFSNDVKIEKAFFDVFPPLEPYSSENYQKNQYQFQPYVTVFMALNLAKANFSKEALLLNLQTSFSSRVYNSSNRPQRSGG